MRLSGADPHLIQDYIEVADKVLQEFDATHCLSKLSAAWANLSTGATSFGELLQAFPRDQSSFFGSGEVEKKLVFEVNRLKAKLAIKQVDLEAERQGR